MANWFDNVLDDPAHRQPPLVVHGHGKTLLIRYLLGYYHDRVAATLEPGPFNGYMLNAKLIVLGFRPKVLPMAWIYNETLTIRQKGALTCTIPNETSWIIESTRRIDYCVNIQVMIKKKMSYEQAYELGKQHRVDGVRLTARYVRSVLK